MSKYNHIKSIPVDSIPEEEMTTAIKEWAEDNEAMERLLWNCYKNNIKTNGCHADGSPYLGISYYEDDENKNELAKLLMASLAFKDSVILFSPDGGNPLSGDDWYLPTITLGMMDASEQEANSFLNYAADSLEKDKANDNEDEILFSNLINMLDFMINKDSALSFRLNHKTDDKYIFSLEAAPISDTVYLYFNQLFSQVGFEEVKGPDGVKRHNWKIECEDMKSLTEQIQKTANLIINNYSLEPPTSEEEIFNFNQLARFKKREFGDSLEGKEKMAEWLQMKEEERDRKFEEMKRH